MSCSKWAYTPEMCDGDICVGDCDLCDKPKIEQIHNTATTQVQADEYEKCNSDDEKMVEKCDYIKRDAVSDYLEQNNMPWRDWVKDIPSADVVEADKAQKEIDYWHDKSQSYEQTILKLSLNKADVVEAVRCKDCKYYNAIDTNRLSECEKGFETYGNDYCSYGERAKHE